MAHNSCAANTAPSLRTEPPRKWRFASQSIPPFFFFFFLIAWPLRELILGMITDSRWAVGRLNTARHEDYVLKWRLQGSSLPCIPTIFCPLCLLILPFREVSRIFAPVIARIALRTKDGGRGVLRSPYTSLLAPIWRTHLSAGRVIVLRWRLSSI